MVNFQSGLLGVSETSSDIRNLLDRETQNVRAAEADTLVFAGGIGENAPTVRARICDGLGFLGIELEEKPNAANESVISAAASRVAVRVIHTDEELMIARSVRCALGLGPSHLVSSPNAICRACGEENDKGGQNDGPY